MWLSSEITTRAVVGGFMLLAGMTKLSAGPAWRRSWLAAFRLAPAGLLGLVTGAVAVSLLRGLRVPCGCLGKFGQAPSANQATRSALRRPWRTRTSPPLIRKAGGLP